MPRKIVKPKLKTLEKTTIDNCIKNNDFFELDVYDTNLDISCNQLLTDITFDSCHFHNIDFTKYKFDKVSITDCIFENCDLSNLIFDNINIYRSIFNKCKLLGTNFTECFLEDVIFDNVNGQYINFYGTIINNSKLMAVNFSKGRFILCKTKNLEINNSIFNNFEMIKNSLKDCDFSSSEIEHITVDSDSLKDIIVNEYQALTLSHLLGIRIKD